MHIFQFLPFVLLMVLMTEICSEQPGDCRIFRVGFTWSLHIHALCSTFNTMYGAGKGVDWPCCT